MGRGGRELYPVRVFICVWKYAAKDQARPTTSTASGPDDKARTAGSGRRNVSDSRSNEMEVQRLDLRLEKRGEWPHLHDDNKARRIPGSAEPARTVRLWTRGHREPTNRPVWQVCG